VIDSELVLPDEVRHVEAEAGDVDGQFLFCLLEAHEDAGLVELCRPANDELHREERLARAGPAADQRRPSCGQSAAGNVIQAAYPGRRFWIDLTLLLLLRAFLARAMSHSDEALAELGR